MSMSATDHRLPFGSATTWLSKYCQSSMLQRGILVEQIPERSRDLRTAERLRNQQDLLGPAGAKALVGQLGRVADDHDRKVGVVRVVPQGIEERLAHFEG